MKLLRKRASVFLELKCDKCEVILKVIVSGEFEGTTVHGEAEAFQPLYVFAWQHLHPKVTWVLEVSLNTAESSFNLDLLMMQDSHINLWFVDF